MKHSPRDSSWNFRCFFFNSFIDVFRVFYRHFFFSEIRPTIYFGTPMEILHIYPGVPLEFFYFFSGILPGIPPGTLVGISSVISLETF